MRLRQRLITGLVTLLPLIVTLYLLGWVYTYSGAYIQAFLRLFGLEVPREMVTRGWWAGKSFGTSIGVTVQPERSSDVCEATESAAPTGPVAV